MSGCGRVKGLVEAASLRRLLDWGDRLGRHAVEYLVSHNLCMYVRMTAETHTSNSTYVRTYAQNICYVHNEKGGIHIFEKQRFECLNPEVLIIADEDVVVKMSNP